MERSDAEMIRIWKNTPSNYNYFANRDFINDIEQEAWVSSKLNSSNSLYLIIIDNESDNPIGMILLDDINHKNRNASWGIYIANLEYRKKIYAVESAVLLFNYSFDYLSLNKIYGNTLESNVRGREFHSFIGFSESAIFTNHVYIQGDYINLVWISLFSEEWTQVKNKLQSFIDNFKMY